MSTLEEIAKRKDEYAKVSASQDAAAIADFYEDGALFLPPGAPLVNGRDAVEARLAKFLGTAASLKMEPEIVSVIESGDITIEVTRFLMTMQPVDGDPRSHWAKHLVVWREQSDGTLKIVAEALNRDA